MILDDVSGCKKVVFHTADAVRVSATAGDGRQIHGLRRMRRGECPDESQIVTNGWDHEHCELCNTHIDPGDYAYTNADDLWVCLTCFENSKNGTLVNDL